ncbi:TniQ family protein [Streptomyces mirabilis]|uniref:TniQ family protein n=1 Tax=Streptomyces mirabilis TaxID=68239 RepID=UPI003643470B
MTSPASEHLTELPVNVRPKPGETTDSYIRRLARANHLRPSYLHCFLAGPPFWFGKPRLERLAALSGRPQSTLQRVLFDASSPRGRTKPNPRNLRIRTHKALTQDGLDMTFAIQHDALDGNTTVRAIAQRWEVPRWLVRRVLDSAVVPDRTAPRHRPKINAQTEQQVNAMIESGMGPKEIWKELMDTHDVSVSMGSLLLRRTSQRRREPGDQ